MSLANILDMTGAEIAQALNAGNLYVRAPGEVTFLYHPELKGRNPQLSEELKGMGDPKRYIIITRQLTRPWPETIELAIENKDLVHPLTSKAFVAECYKNKFDEKKATAEIDRLVNGYNSTEIPKALKDILQK